MDIWRNWILRNGKVDRKQHFEAKPVSIRYYPLHYEYWELMLKEATIDSVNCWFHSLTHVGLPEQEIFQNLSAFDYWSLAI